MQDRFEMESSPARPRRARSGHVPVIDADSLYQAVEATSGGLIRATLGSAVTAGAILVFAWLPAEYGIDPTGVGRVLGLTEMGEIKQSLYAEAAADIATTDATDPAKGNRLTLIEKQQPSIAAIVEPDQPASSPASEQTQQMAATQPTEAPQPIWRDEVSYTLAPTNGIEVKLVMEEGAVAEFEWTANGSVLNYDTHGDGGGNKISYEKGRSVPSQSGSLTAAFTGNHGWFWRNRTETPVTVTLRARGNYTEMRAP
jgi:hypothetical protein